MKTERDRSDKRHEMTYPSGGVVLLDAGALLAATPSELSALQSRLREAAAQTTPDGRPFRACSAETALGDVFVAPVRRRDAPHVVQVVREDGRTRRVVVELDGPDGGGHLAVVTPTAPDAPAREDRPRPGTTEPILRVPPPIAPEAPPQPGQGDGIPLSSTVAWNAPTPHREEPRCAAC